MKKHAETDHPDEADEVKFIILEYQSPTGPSF